jgi:hypothetical protein
LKYSGIIRAERIRQLSGSIFNEAENSSGVSLLEEAAFRGLARKAFGSSHLSIAQRIRSGLSAFLELSSEDGSKMDVNRCCGVAQSEGVGG